MKYFLITVAVMLILAGCTTQYQTTNNDDVYYSAKLEPVKKQILVVKEPESGINTYAQAEPLNAEQEQAAEYYDENVDTVYYDEQQNVSGENYDARMGYNEDDYYDYAYSARMRRFHSPYRYDNYYNDFYTNSYWYDMNPWSCGTSIYMGYNWWGPSFSWGYNPWGMNYYSPWYYGFGYGSYWSGYSNGYWNGYWNGYYDANHYYYDYSNYYNSYDRNSNYYGHRGSVGGSGSITRNDNRTFGERYEASVASARTISNLNDRRGNGDITTNRNTMSQASRESVSGRSNNGLTRGISSPQDSRNGSRGTVINPNARGQRTGTTGNAVNNNRQEGTSPQRSITNTDQPQRKYQYSAPSRSGQTEPGKIRNGTIVRPNTQSYTSPEYNRPRSGQEYTSPKYRNTQPSVIERNNSRTSSPTYNAPRSGNPVYNQPSQERSTPSRSNDSYQAPRNNSNSQPSRSNTYSPPPSRSSENSTPHRSSSNESYSAPRSSSSGSSGSSSGSSGSSSEPSRGSSSGSGGRR